MAQIGRDTNGNSRVWHSESRDIDSLSLSLTARRIALLAAWLFVFAGAGAADDMTLRIPRVSNAPALEDFLQMGPSEEWEGKLARVQGFVQRKPDYGQPASQRTEVYLGYDASSLYIIFVAFDSEPKRIRARLEPREGVRLDEDQLGVYLDTFHDERRAYQFACNALGIQSDSLYSEDTGNIDDSFDTVWSSRGALTSEGFVVWMSIPFKSVRFREMSSQDWGILIWRWIPRRSEGSWWPHATTQTQGQLGRSATMAGMTGISPAKNYQFLSYGSWRAFRAPDVRNAQEPVFAARAAEVNAGLDSKTILKDSLVLDLTVNPDFSQVESDEPQTVVNQRFEVFFPEKRPFFTENANYFELPLAGGESLLFTRRIADPLFGARLTGKMGAYTIGGLIADDESPGKSAPRGDPLDGERAFFGVFRVSRDFLRQSNFGAMYTERRLKDSYNRVVAVDTRLRFNKTWSASLVGAGSWTQGLTGPAIYGSDFEALLTRAARAFNYDLRFVDRSPDFRTEVGFITWTDIRYLTQRCSYTFWRQSPWLSNLKPEMYVEQGWYKSGSRAFSVMNPSFTVEFNRPTTLTVYWWKWSDVLRPQDYPALDGIRSFDQDSLGFTLTDRSLRSVRVQVGFDSGLRLNYIPPAGQPPAVGRYTSGNVTVSVSPFDGLAIDNSYLLDRMLSRTSDQAVFNSHIFRSTWNWQLSRELSVRFIAQYDALLTNPARTSAGKSRNFNADFLVTYLVHPGTALYVGYNSNFRRPGLSENGPPQDRFTNDGRQFFVKVSYLLRP
jgi:hypothetical protein